MPARGEAAVRYVRKNFDEAAILAGRADAKEVTHGYECGLSIKNFNDIKVGDIVEAYVMEQIEQ